MKTDKHLGHKVNKYLVKKGVEVPMTKKFSNKEEKKRNISNLFAKIMEELNLDLFDDSLSGTPNRVAKMYIDEIFYGLDYNNFPKCTAVNNKMKYDEMVTVDNIVLSSNCEHHFVVIDGYATVSYIPKDKVIGLSKINRIVDFFAKRPQIQERLTEQIYYALNCILETDNIAVKIKAVHYCVKSRGVKDVTSSTITTKLGGVFKKIEVRNEFLNCTK
jgi:GTP cyclohydrolase I|tara:strand:- start:4857 stop:5507 length:651 start_codon:yes stop_codon:yes gene_type:complete